MTRAHLAATLLTLALLLGCVPRAPLSECGTRLEGVREIEFRAGAMATLPRGSRTLVVAVRHETAGLRSPVGDADVYLRALDRAPDAPPFAAARTDASGIARLVVQDSATVVALVGAGGYETVRDTILVRPGAHDTLFVALRTHNCLIR